MRRQRVITSCTTYIAWPMCSEPVTLGGGMTMVNGSWAWSRWRGNSPAFPVLIPLCSDLLRVVGLGQVQVFHSAFRRSFEGRSRILTTSTRRSLDDLRIISGEDFSGRFLANRRAKSSKVAPHVEHWFSSNCQTSHKNKSTAGGPAFTGQAADESADFAAMLAEFEGTAKRGDKAAGRKGRSTPASPSRARGQGSRPFDEPRVGFYRSRRQT